MATLLSALGALSGLVPFVGLAELAALLLADGPADRGAVITVAWLIVSGLGARGLFSGLALTITHFADVDLQADLRRRIIRRLGRVPLGWYSENSSGVVRKAAQNDIAELHHLVAHHSVEMVAAVITPLGGLAYLCWIDWRLGLLAIATLPFYAAAYAWMMRGYKDKMAQMNAGFTKISAAVVEFVSGISVVKAFGRARKAHESYRKAAGEFGEFYAAWVRPMLRMEAVSAMALSAPLVGLISLAGVLWFVDAGWVTPVEAMTEVLVAMVIPTTVMAISFGEQDRQTAGAAALRLDELLATPALPVAAAPRKPADNRVEFDDVRFSYDGTNEVLQGVSLDLRPGTVTALVGPSGSGKSTLATLLPRFHDVTGGAVRLGGVDVRQIAPEELYRWVGFVLQDVALVHGTVADNIRLGRPDATDEDVVAAAKAAQIDARIRELPGEYESMGWFQLGKSRTARQDRHQRNSLGRRSVRAFADTVGERSRHTGDDRGGDPVLRLAAGGRDARLRATAVVDLQCVRLADRQGRRAHRGSRRDGGQPGGRVRQAPAHAAGVRAWGAGASAA